MLDGRAIMSRARRFRRARNRVSESGWVGLGKVAGRGQRPCHGTIINDVYTLVPIPSGGRFGHVTSRLLGWISGHIKIAARRIGAVHTAHLGTSRPVYTPILVLSLSYEFLLYSTVLRPTNHSAFRLALPEIAPPAKVGHAVYLIEA